jgi:aminomethyltransferase
MLYGEEPISGHQQVGYCTSFVYSPVLQRHIGLARVRPELAAADTPLRLEIALLHHNTTVGVRTAKLPFFNPERKTSTP